MKKFLVKFLLFILIVCVVDKAFGMVSVYLFDHAKSGKTEKNKYIVDRTNEDILIFGSSRGVHHYDPRIIEDSLGMTCYNCAYDGCGSITAYGLLLSLLNHYTPKVILYDICQNFDYLLDEKDNTKYLGPLKLLYDRKGVDSIFIGISPTEQWKMKSCMYRINSNFIAMLSENVMNRNNTIKGYLPRNRKMTFEPVIDETLPVLEYDPLKQDCLNRIIKLCKSKRIHLIFYASPSYKKRKDEVLYYAKRVAASYGLPFINHYCDTAFVYHKDWFYDSVHMNTDGATAFSKVVGIELKKYLKR